ncbi:alpha-amylase [Ktedonobacter sp. SOSP1-85]|uniref:glycoside hydrolase family 57 protein n=1 Tax=Ktedonobacter sp. SOSP1-85 TaxID=2778367 RepID=UPI001915264F|nr:glycoside hydrolase family 57 protein [Ktedonobacter sp. SOSP1-85]GHO74538.1 alpha-amylase [Ktedonobacter sp. SOSP1-85]
MVADVALYTVVHQPRRLKLPAQPIPRGASLEDIARCLFDEALNERYFRQVAQNCYYPATRVFLDLVRHGLRLSIGFSLSFLQQAQTWEPSLLDLFRELVAEERVELLGVEPYHSLLFLFDLPAFEASMRKMAEDLHTIFGKRPRIVDSTELAMSAPLYNALDAAGFQGALMDGQAHILGWRDCTYLYRYGDEGAYARPIAARRLRAREERSSHAPLLFARHRQLSDDIGVRFSDIRWSDFPLYATTYASWLAQTPGEQLVLGWDFETFGERHSRGSGIFDFLRALPGELEHVGIQTHTLSELGERHLAGAHYLPLPVTPALQGGSLDPEGGSEYVATSAQRRLLQLMSAVHNMARLTEQPKLVDIAHWLSQVDHLRYADVSAQIAPFLPREWRHLEVPELIYEQQQVYLNTLHAMEPYLPARAARRVKPRARPLKGQHAPVDADVLQEEASFATPKPRPRRRQRELAAPTPTPKS